MNPPRCGDPEIGKMLAHYELGLLDVSDREQFEGHLLLCDACAEEVENMYSVAAALRANRESVRIGLAKDGITTEALQRRITTKVQSGLDFGFAAHLRRLFDRIRGRLERPRARWSAIGVTTGLVMALVFYFVLVPRHETASPYVPLLSFHALPYDGPGTIRGEGESAQQEFQLGIKNYMRGDYRKAARHLERAVSQSPDQAQRWLYLGISHYMDRKPVSAIEALSRAEALGQGGERRQARWYLAQAHLLNGDRESAQPLLESLAAQKREHGAEASELLRRLYQ